MKVDCHCHILPGIDDGAQTLEDSVFLAGKLVEWGYRRAVCTSHSSFLYRNTPATVTAAADRLRRALDAEGIYEWTGSDLHNKKYSDFFDAHIFMNL